MAVFLTPLTGFVTAAFLPPFLTAATLVVVFDFGPLFSSLSGRGGGGGCGFDTFLAGFRPPFLGAAGAGVVFAFLLLVFASLVLSVESKECFLFTPLLEVFSAKVSAVLFTFSSDFCALFFLVCLVCGGAGGCFPFLPALLLVLSSLTPFSFAGGGEGEAAGDLGVSSTLLAPFLPLPLPGAPFLGVFLPPFDLPGVSLGGGVGFAGVAVSFFPPLPGLALVVEAGSDLRFLAGGGSSSSISSNNPRIPSSSLKLTPILDRLLPFTSKNAGVGADFLLPSVFEALSTGFGGFGLFRDRLFVVTCCVADLAMIALVLAGTIIDKIGGVEVLPVGVGVLLDGVGVLLVSISSFFLAPFPFGRPLGVLGAGVSLGV